MPGVDDIVMQGFMYKFKPGLTSNFKKVYVQISNVAFRYFKEGVEYNIDAKPLVAFRKKIIKFAQEYVVNKGSYIKKGSKLSKN